MEEKIAQILTLLDDFDLYSYGRSHCDNKGSDTSALSDYLLDRGYTEKKAKVCCGMTKVCIIFSGWDYVVKMDRKGYQECKTEVKIYRIAKKHRVEKAFLETRKIGTTKHGINLYIQPKVSISVEDMSINERHKWEKKTKNISEKLVLKVMDKFYSAPRRSIWVRAAILCYGKKFMWELEEVSRKCYINDLHSLNLGFIKNRPVILDYSGYHGSRCNTSNDEYYIHER